MERTAYEVQCWVADEQCGSRWKPMGRAFNREQAMGQSWLVRQILEKQGFKRCRLRIRVIRPKKRKGAKSGKRK